MTENFSITFEETNYPFFQQCGNASQFSLPFAKHFCKGIGYDIGFKKTEWKFPNAIGVDIDDKSNDLHANYLYDYQVDYIYSSHCLEHLDNWVDTLEYWISKVKKDGVVFLYLPDFSQKYWRPWNNRKHKHVFFPDIFKCFCESKKLEYFCSGIDLNNSFMIVIFV